MMLEVSLMLNCAWLEPPLPFSEAPPLPFSDVPPLLLLAELDPPSPPTSASRSQILL